MTPKQKVLSIRLAELIIKNHTFAKSIGLEVKNKFEKKSKEENWWLLEKREATVELELLKRPEDFRPVL